MTRTTTRRGTVTAFDESVGLGELADVGDGRVLGFHCTAIADGSRTVPVGATVLYHLDRRHLGRPEAAGIVVV